ncbi:MAG: arylsulfatase [Eubacterium sp.]|nr:arylsulfatase [Eubacterium sp.]
MLQNSCDKPNVIFVFVDDLGYGDISCNNPGSRVSTSNIDSLAHNGLRFTDMHSSSAVCSPSRYALLTGRYNWRSRLKKAVLPGTSPSLLEKDRETLGSLFQRNGYKTACVGKWHLGMDWQTHPGVKQSFKMFEKISDRDDYGLRYDLPILDGPLKHGFDYFYGTAGSLDQAPYVIIENDLPKSVPTKVIGTDECDHRSPKCIQMCEKGPAAEDFDLEKIIPHFDDKVLSLIDEYSAQDSPFFIYYPTLAVHGPILPTEEYKGKSEIGLYGDFILQLDGFIGRLEDKLKECSLLENTIVIFASDNGCSTIVDIPKLKSMGHSPSYIYRGNKSCIWDGGHRVPFIVNWPGHIAPGVCDNLSCLTDMYATFAELLGASYDASTAEDSFSNLCLWDGNHKEIHDYIIHHSVSGFFSIRNKEWKLEMCAGSGGNAFPRDMNKDEVAGLPPIQLYHISEDPGETDNVYDKHPDIVNDMKKLLEKYIKAGRSTPGTNQKNAPCDNWPGLEWMEDF